MSREPSAGADKAAEAFRTISEVADVLDVPMHVLRFWEQKFPALKPMKRGGGRRFYRPEDVRLIVGLKHLLHAEGYTIKGVQKILREEGVEFVKALGDGSMASSGSDAATSGVQSAARGAGSPSGRSAARPASPIRAVPMMRDAIELAISELEECRAILRGEAPPVSVRVAQR
ncbi:MAG: MerR family transcriptional regulator [Hyphomicrobiaceae bacterium]